MSNPKKLTREEVKKIIVETLKPYGVSKIALFGSFAREEAEPTSDIDILVTLLPPNKRKAIGLKWFTIGQELERALGVPVDLVTEASLDPKLKFLIQKDLDVIYEKAG